jgi:hypothetical protein
MSIHMVEGIAVSLDDEPLSLDDIERQRTYLTGFRDGVLAARQALSLVHAEVLSPSLPVASITCPQCAMTSYNWSDIKHGYCGNCHTYTSRPG